MSSLIVYCMKAKRSLIKAICSLSAFGKLLICLVHLLGLINVSNAVCGFSEAQRF